MGVAKKEDEEGEHVNKSRRLSKSVKQTTKKETPKDETPGGRLTNWERHRICLNDFGSKELVTKTYTVKLEG